MSYESFHIYALEVNQKITAEIYVESERILLSFYSINMILNIKNSNLNCQLFIE